MSVATSASDEAQVEHERPTLSSVSEQDKDADSRPEDEHPPSTQLQRALVLLAKSVQPYLPLRREPGSNVFEGLDLVDQDKQGKPFSAMGIVLHASKLIKSWEPQLESSLAKRIELLQSKEQPISMRASLRKSKKQLRKTKPDEISQPIAHALTLPKKDAKFQKFAVIGGGMVFVQEAYLRQMELENVVYRRHLETLESELHLKVAKQVRKEIDKATKDAQNAILQRKAKQMKAPSKATPKAKAATAQPENNKRKEEALNDGHTPKKQKVTGEVDASAKKDVRAPHDVVDLTRKSENVAS